MALGSKSSLSGVDPLVNETFAPYFFHMNNPIMVIDPNGKKGFIVTTEGEFIEVNNVGGDEFDILYNQDMSSTAATTFAPGTFDKSIMQGHGKTETEQGTVIEVSYDYNSFENTDAEKGQILYDFVKDNTDVEWSIVTGSSSSSDDKVTHVSTSHSSQVTYGGIELTKKTINTRKYSDVHFEHSHPGPNTRVGPSDKTDYPNSGGDVENVFFLYTTHAPYFNVNLRTSIYDKATKTQVFYNHKGPL